MMCWILCESYLLKGMPQSKRVIRGWWNSLREPWRIVPSAERSLFARIQVTRWKRLKMFTIIIQTLQFWWDPDRAWTDIMLKLSPLIQFNSIVWVQTNIWIQFKSRTCIETLPSSPQPMYKEVTPIASRATIKLLSRVSNRTNENIPSSMSTKFSPCSSY